MRRLDLMALAAGGLVLRPVVASGQQQRVPVVGVLVTGNPDPGPAMREFQQALEELGYRDGDNLRLEIRSAEGDLGRLPALADEFVRQKVDIIATLLTPAALAAKRATSDIPIVIIGAADPVGMGIVPSLARPGGNITGVAALVPELTGKNIELLREILPELHRIAALCNAPDPFSKPFLDHVNQAGGSLGIEIVPVMVAAAPQLDDAFRGLIDRNVAAIVVQPSLPLRRVAELALHRRLPTASPLALFPRMGGLMAWACRKLRHRPHDGLCRPQFHALISLFTCGRPKQTDSSRFCSHTVQAIDSFCRKSPHVLGLRLACDAVRLRSHATADERELF